MAYCTIQQLEDRITAGLLARHFTETGIERARVLTAYLEAASAKVDAYLSVRYAVPLAEVSPLVADITLSLALWQIEADRGTVGDHISPARQIPYDKSMELLGKLSAGEVKLGIGAADTPGAAAGLVVNSPPALFAEDSPGMEGF